ncbi:hypothetical protein HOU03_gp439 [Caulobacter phage CcrSC]|uniref:Uncharacterized protein n=1 Tax=Caulobacter phage CcrSC TaxID=2283272 RepID=A0A385EGD5_9CAUD|nr:hypothetical protein HOU03_gp439 [Caulobacter phage CcrSC]AXQ69829.1 hypothetical protein CcrSC_gp247 [Caulobacter phage CcrSC]
MILGRMEGAALEGWSTIGEGSIGAPAEAGVMMRGLIATR